MKLIKNKKGFTLVELIVGTAILGVIGLTTAMLMTSGTNMYRGVHRRSTVLFKSQVASTQLTEAIVDCKYSFSVHDDTLFLGDKDGEDNVIDVYYFDEDEHTIYLRVDRIGTTGEITQGEAVPFCYNVHDISYEPFANNETGEAYALKFVLTIEKFGLNYPRNEVLSLRNHPTLVSGDSAADTEQKLAEEMGA